VRGPIRLATRKSELALFQANAAAEALAAAGAGLEHRIVPVVSTGDKITDRPLHEIGGKDLFVKALEESILAGEADAAVHSLKDVGSALDARFVIAATLERADPRDAAVTRGGGPLRSLPAGSRVGTCSPRRAAVLKATHPGLDVVPIRGNVRTRLAKLEEGLDAVVLALAGLRRLGLGGLPAEILDPGVFTPSPGQGTIAIECLAEDEETVRVASLASCAASMAASRCERAVAAHLGASCRTPLGAYAQVDGGSVSVSCLLANPADGDMIRASCAGDAGRPEKVGERAARDLIGKGAGEIIKMLDGSETHA